MSKKVLINYFSHDVNSSFDNKILCIESQFGIVAYAWYFKILEFMGRANDYKIELTDVFKKVIQNQLQFKTVAELDGFIDVCVLLGLFKLENNFLISESFMERIESAKELIEKKRLAGVISGKKRKELAESIKKPEKNEVEEIVTENKKQLEQPKQKVIEKKNEQFGKTSYPVNIMDDPFIKKNMKIYERDGERILKDIKQFESILKSFNKSASMTEATRNKIEYKALDGLKKMIEIGLIQFLSESHITEIVEKATKSCKNKDFYLSNIYNAILDKITDNDNGIANDSTEPLYPVAVHFTRI